MSQNDGQLKSKLLELSKSTPVLSSIKRETLKALISIFSQFSYLNSEEEVIKIKSVYGNPERAISRLKAEDNLILPIISVTSVKGEESKERQRYTPVMQTQKIWNEETLRAIRIVSLSPKPVNLIYDINIWSQYNYHIDQLTAQIRSLFNPALTLHTPTLIDTQVFLVEESDESLQSPGDGIDRLLIKKFIISVETYIPNPVYMLTSSGKIQEIVGEIETRK